MKIGRPVLLAAILFLFFIQLLTDFIGAIYAFGLLGTSIPPELGFALLLFSPLLLLFLRRPGPRLLTLLFSVALLARVVEPLLDTRLRLIVAGVGVAAWLMLFPILLWRDVRRQDADSGLILTAGLLLATLTSVMLRAWGSGVDISTLGWGQLVGAGLALLAGWLWWRQRPGRALERVESPEERGNSVIGLVLGVMAGLTLIYFAFAAPYVMVRWTGADAFWVLLIMLTSWSVWVWGWVWWKRSWRKDWLSIGMWLFVIFLFSAISELIPYFPHTAAGYPLPDATGAPPFGDVIQLFIMLLLSPLLFAGMRSKFSAIQTRHPSLHQLAVAFSLASIFLLLAIFAHVFTTTYDYIPVIGPWFRNRFAWVYGAVGVVFLMGVAEEERRKGAVLSPAPRALAAAVPLLAIAILGFHWLTTPQLQPAPPNETVTVLTYNIQQGYSADGRKNYDGQLAQIRAIDPDIIGLQECDTARIANSNDDVVRYLANHLGMYSYYGPKTVVGTFGVALLSRYPIQNAETYYLYSEGEQVAAIEAVVDVGGEGMRVLVTHLGNGGPMIQQQQFLELVGTTPQRTVALGDFNFRPDSEQYQLTTRTLLDAWTQKWPDWIDDQGQKPDDMIDHIFVSPDIQVRDARYAPAGPSDHPALAAVLAP